MKKNCWEVKKCGRQPGGIHAKALGVCPATTEMRLNGVHDGRNAGRACWIMTGTLCGGQVQGHFGEKFKNCTQCEFYTYVKSEEGNRYILSPVLMEKLRNPATGASR
jgi:hypothetical protein